MATRKNVAEDINRLVALASTDRRLDVPASRRTPNIESEVTFLPRSQHLAPKVGERTARILDAIAALLVSEERGEVYAVGGQIEHTSDRDPSKGSVKLYVATNQTVPSTTKAFLIEVWKILQQMAERNRQALPEKSQMRKQSFMDETPPKKDTLDGPSKLPEDWRRLIRMAHRHCFLKWKKQINKHYTAFVQFSRVFRQDIYPNLNRDDPILEPLGFLMRQIQGLHRSIKAFEQEGTDPVRLIDDMDFPWRMVQVQYAMEKLDLNDWSRINEWHDSEKKPISRYFAKVAGFQVELSHLERFARSPGLYRILKKNSFSVVCLDEEHSPVELPSTRREWEKVVSEALESSEFGWNEQSKNAVDRALKSKMRNEGIVHCECKVLKYFATQLAGPRPMSYIGVSKLSCAACDAVFSAWNTQSSRKYFCRGSHGKWYFPWAVPTGWNPSAVSDDVMIERTYGIIAAHLSRSWHSFGMATRRFSDSSVPSTVEPPNIEPDAAYKEAHLAFDNDEDWD